MANYLKAYKNNGRIYWWLAEAHRNGKKVVQKKLRYFGVNRPSEIYSLFLMKLDDKQPLNELWLVWQKEPKVWVTKQRTDFTYWYKLGQETWFWILIFRTVAHIYSGGVEEVWLTKAQNKKDAILNVKNNRATNLVESLETLKLKDDPILKKIFV